MKEYKLFLERILQEGNSRSDRTKVGTISKFGERMEFDLTKGFPATTTKKLAWKAVVSELLWFISGSGDERHLSEILHQTRDESKTTIWTENANAPYWKDRAAYPGDLGLVYGNMWRKWPADGTSISNLKIRQKEPDTIFIDEDRISSIVYSKNPYDESSVESSFYWLWQHMFLHARAVGVSICDSWKSFEYFKNSIKRVPGFNQYIKDRSKYTLSPSYYGVDQFSESTSAFIPTTYTRSEMDYHTQMSDLSSGYVMRRIFFIDQLDELISGILSDPYGRRHIISAWNPSAIKDMALPPCHIFAQFYVRESDDGVKYLDCQLYQRSADSFLGVPFNIASYALFTHMIAHVCGMQAGKFVHVIGDAHIYSNHVSAVEELLARECFDLPTLHIKRRVTSIDDFTMNDFELTDYQCHATIKAQMAV